MIYRALFLVLAAVALAGCDYCPRPGTLGWTTQFYTPRTPKYPVPTATACGVVPGRGQLGKPAAGTVISGDVGLNGETTAFTGNLTQ